MTASVFHQIAVDPTRANTLSDLDAFKAGPDTFNLWRIVRESGARTRGQLLKELQRLHLPSLEWLCGAAISADLGNADPSDGRDHFLLCAEWRTVRMRVLAKHGAKCQCCGKTAIDGVVINVDHIKPRRQYPELALDESNLQVLCDGCNQGKGNWDKTDWRPEGQCQPVS